MQFVKKFRRITTSGEYLPEIDGFRFFAIMWVVLFHSVHAIFDNSHYILKDSIQDYYYTNIIFANGFQGVVLFFVISGFILGIPFAKQNILKGKKIQLKKYFIRRLTRLEPPYLLAMIFFFVVLVIKGDFTFWGLLPSLGASIIYMHNIIFQTYPYITMIAWSLEIEVQFYLMAPLLSLIFLLPSLQRRSILLTLIVLFPIIQWYFPIKIMTIYSFIEFFLAGLLLADLYVSSVKIKLNYVILSLIGLSLFIPILLINHESTLINGIIYPLLILLFYFVSLQDSIWNKLFRVNIIAMIGGMCYSIYLLHFPFISLIVKFSHIYKVSDTIIPNLVVNSLVVSILTLIVSSIYFKVVERPFMDKNWPGKFAAKIKQLFSNT